MDSAALVRRQCDDLYGTKRRLGLTQTTAQLIDKHCTEFDLENEFKSYCEKVSENFIQLSSLAAEISAASEMLVVALKKGKKIIFCGNGGSAADSQHLAAELMGRYLVDRDPLPAIALTVDTSALTAIGNDYSYEDVFARQLKGIGQEGDVLVALSTSGNSKNVIKAAHTAKEKGIPILGLTGSSGGKMDAICDLCIKVPSQQTNHIQEMHIAIGHMICGAVERNFC